MRPYLQKSRIAGTIILAAATALCLFCMQPSEVPEKVRMDAAFENQIQTEIAERESIAFQGIYGQLELQNGVQYYDAYKELEAQDIEYSVRKKFQDIREIAGSYQVNELVYMHLWSNWTRDYYADLNQKFAVTIGAASFSATGSSDVRDRDYQNVRYIPETVDSELLVFGEDVGIDLSAFQTRKCFQVQDSGQDTGFRIYLLDDQVWIAHFGHYGEGSNPSAWWAEFVFEMVEV